MQSVLCLPLISAKVAVGILVLSAPETDAFIKDDDRLFQIIGNQIANVLKNVDLVRNIQKSYDRREKVLKKLKIAEKKLSDYTKDLEEVIEKRTNELVQSEKLASIGQLVSGVAHELNNPLTIVIGLIDLMIDSNDMPAKQKKRLKKVHTATMRCAKVVENLIKFSRKEVVHNETIDINSIVEETIGFFEYQFMVNNISLKKSIQKNIPPTVGDPQQLKQVFLNIISNAYDSMVSQDNEKLLEVTTHSDDKTIIIEFRDTGHGVLEDHRKRLFEPFFTTKDVGRGTGLGLSLSFGIMKEHNGEIFLDSTYKDGAKFTLVLPIVTAHFKEKNDPETNTINSSTKILIIDDEKDIIEFQKDVLNNYRCKIEIAYDGEQALKKIQKWDFDIILSDIKMPGRLNGIELYSKIQKAKPGLEKRIIFTTGDTASKETKDFFEHIDTYYLVKPFLIKEYIDAINRCLNDQRIERKRHVRVRLFNYISSLNKTCLTGHPPAIRTKNSLFFLYFIADTLLFHIYLIIFS